MNIKHAFIALLAATGCAWAVPHYENLDKALAQAPAENRSILLDFTGTDWCPACIHLSNKILNSPEFDAAVGSRYGIVTLDFPRTKKLLDAIPPQEMKARERLLNEYRVQGLPTVVLLDSAGLPYAVLVGSAENTEQYLARLKEAEAARTARDAAFAEAVTLSGEARARALHKGLQALPEVCRPKYTSVIEEICKSDTEDTLGYIKSARMAKLYVEQFEAFQQLTSTFVGKFDAPELKDSIAKCEEFLKTPELHPEVAQMCLGCMADAYALLHDLPNSIKYSRRAYEAAPNSRAAHRLRTNAEFQEKILKEQSGK